MDDDGLISILFLLTLLLIAFYFAMAETAVSSVSRIRIKALADKGDGRAARVLYILDNFDRAITTILIGTNIVHLAMASSATVMAVSRWGLSAAAGATVSITLIVFFAGEMLPKSISKKYSERLSLALAPSLYFFMKIFTPLSFVLTKIGGAFAMLTKGDGEVTVTEDELYDIIENIKDEGAMDSEKSELVHSALVFADVTVESIITARVDVVAIDVDYSSEQILELLKEQKHSRLPVYKDSIDNIIGVLQLRKYVKAYLKQGSGLDLHSLLDEAYFVHQSANIDELLHEMSRQKMNMAIVTDNYGGTLGIVTVEDILEELVGEIWDEDDDVVESFLELPDGSFEIDASLTVEDAFELMEQDCPEEDMDNKLVGEWVYENFDMIPSEGDSFRFGDLIITVSNMRQHRIVKINALALPEGPEGGEV